MAEGALINYLVNEHGAEHDTAEKIANRVVTHSDGKLYIRLGLDELLPPPKGEALFYSKAGKFVIPVPADVEPIPTETRFVTADGKIHQDSTSVAKPGDVIVVNDAPAAVTDELSRIYDRHGESRNTIITMLKHAEEKGVTNIFPAPAEVLNTQYAADDPSQDPHKPGVYHVAMPRAVSRIDGPVIIDQTIAYGPAKDGSPNLQTQPDTVFIFKLNDKGEPLQIKGAPLPKVDSYDITPFKNEYVNAGRQEPERNELPLLALQGELAGKGKFVSALAHKLKEMNQAQQPDLAVNLSQVSGLQAGKPVVS